MINIKADQARGKHVRKMPIEHSPSRTDSTSGNDKETGGSKNVTPQMPDVRKLENTASEVHAANLKDIKITTFWRARPKLWFVSLESEFAAFEIRADEAKYRVIVRHLDEQTMLAVAEILEQPPELNKYDTLKNALIERFSDLVKKQMRTLLSEIELGDKKPSILLREMRALAGTNISDNLLRTLWLQRLLASVQEVLVVLNGVSLDKLALCADKATDCTRVTTIATATHLDAEGDLHQLKQQINELTQAVAKISTSGSRKNPSKENDQDLLTDLRYVITIEDLGIKHGSAYNHARPSLP